MFMFSEKIVGAIDLRDLIDCVKDDQGLIQEVKVYRMLGS